MNQLVGHQYQEPNTILIADYPHAFAEVEDFMEYAGQNPHYSSPRDLAWQADHDGAMLLTLQGMPA